MSEQETMTDVAVFRHYSSEVGEYETLVIELGSEHSAEGGGPDEEGYNYWGHTTRHRPAEYDLPARLEHEWSSDSRDCDGRMTTGGEMWVRLRLVHTEQEQGVRIWMPECDAEGIPVWHHERSEQRDYTAEAAGY